MRTAAQRSGFLVGIAFALVAGLAAVAWQLTMAPVLGPSGALAAFTAVATVLYLLTVAKSWHQGLGVATLSAVVLVFVLLVLPSAGALLLAAAVALGVARSGMLYRSEAGRSLVLEVLLLSVGLAFAGGLLGDELRPVTTGLAVWGFFLVQSLFFLVGNRQRAAPVDPGSDAFDRAAHRLREILAN